MGESISVEVGRADRVAVVRVSRPEVRNAIDRATMEELDAAIARLEGEADLGCVILAAEGERTFIAGGDLRDFASLDTPEKGQAMGARMQQILARLEALPVPTIAAVGGDAYGGGCEVALACDLRVMAEHAHLVFSQARLGLITGWGGTPRLVRAVGGGHAMRILLTGQYVGAREAQQIGLCAAIAPSGLALATALDLARQITRHPAASIRALKELVWRSAELPLGAATALENELFGQRWASEEHRRALREFFARRAPDFAQEVPEPEPKP
ncbi:MAG: enoyl-CoA hydratase [Myxococcales bacterium]